MTTCIDPETGALLNKRMTHALFDCLYEKRDTWGRESEARRPPGDRPLPVQQLVPRRIL